jgi:uncharacterized protein (TIGR00255 family)
MSAAAVQSMTGFAAVDRQIETIAAEFEARSVNARSLDVRVRLPAGHERQEPAVRRQVAARFRRGTITVSLALRRAEGGARYLVNHEQLAAYLEAIQSLAASGAVAAPRADGLLALKGVVESAAEGEEELAEDALAAAVEDLLDALAANRRAEGERIVPVIREQLAAMDRLRAEIDAHPERSPAAVKARLDRQIAELLAGQSLSDERLHQEAALMATRADVREELDRLAAHTAAARALLDEGGPVGRKLDFLAQELNRESNTICAKAPHHAVTALGLELKAAVEQMREQVQNLE